VRFTEPDIVRVIELFGDEASDADLAEVVEESRLAHRPAALARRVGRFTEPAGCSAVYAGP